MEYGTKQAEEALKKVSVSQIFTILVSSFLTISWCAWVQGRSQMKKWFGGSSKFDAAAEYFEKAANLFKTDEKCEI